MGSEMEQMEKQNMGEEEDGGGEVGGGGGGGEPEEIQTQLHAGLSEQIATQYGVTEMCTHSLRHNQKEEKRHLKSIGLFQCSCRKHEGEQS